MDLGEYSQAGHGLAKSLERDADCPENAVYFDMVNADAQATPILQRRVACLFECDSGNFAWRHRRGPDDIESRKRGDLVLRMIATLGNYDYAFDWVFMQDGAIRVAVGATGATIPRPADFPVMPTARHEFTLRPVDCFSRNPALDLPK